MAEIEVITPEKASEPQATQASGFCGTCGEMVEDGQLTCWRCERAQRKAEREKVAEQELIAKNTRAYDLADLLDEASIPLQTFFSLFDDMDDGTHARVLIVLRTLIGHQQVGIEKIAAAIAETLGKVKLLQCKRHMKINGKAYHDGDFFHAILVPREVQGDGAPLP
jgi:hypothetical protein